MRPRTDVADRDEPLGRLAPAPRSSDAVRCGCERCGAHVMATPGADGRFHGICRVCGSDEVKPLR